MNGALFLARVVLALHVAFAGLVILGPLAAFAGRRLPGSRLLRVGSLLAVTFLVLRTWCGIPCVLTSVENRLRDAAGSAAAAPTGLDRAGHILVLRGADPDGFRWRITAWAVLTAGAFLGSGALARLSWSRVA